VKGSSPVKQNLTEWPTNYEAGKATLTHGSTVLSAPGVQALGMYRRLLKELGKTSDRRSWTKTKIRRQGVMPESRIMRPSVFRSIHSSENRGDRGTAAYGNPKEVG
jgi:hypothetical protein